MEAVGDSDYNYCTSFKLNSKYFVSMLWNFCRAEVKEVRPGQLLSRTILRTRWYRKSFGKQHFLQNQHQRDSGF